MIVIYNLEQRIVASAFWRLHDASHFVRMSALKKECRKIGMTDEETKSVVRDFVERDVLRSIGDRRNPQLAPGSGPNRRKI